MGVIINIMNNKGGCGKTTTACNLSDALGKKGKRVLVIDLDSQCNTTSILFPKTVQIRKCVYELIDPNDENGSDLTEYTYMTDYKNVAVIPNVSDTANLEPDLIEKAPESFMKLRNHLRDFCIASYDYTIIDNPPNIGTFVLCSLHAADFAIVPIRAGSAFSVEGLIKATQLINRIRERGNPDLRFLRLLINGRDKRTAISKTLVDQLRNTFGDGQIFDTEIPQTTAFERAESNGATILKSEPTTPGATAFRDLAKELIHIIEAPQKRERRAKSRD